MTEERYSARQQRDLWYVWDNLDDLPVGEGFLFKMQAEVIVSRLNKRDVVQENVLDAVRRERARQDGKWGVPQNEAGVWLAILMEEVGEVAKAILEGDPSQAEKELVEAVAVGVAWLEHLERTR